MNPLYHTLYIFLLPTFLWGQGVQHWEAKKSKNDQLITRYWGHSDSSYQNYTCYELSLSGLLKVINKNTSLENDTTFSVYQYTQFRIPWLKTASYLDSLYFKHGDNLLFEIIQDSLSSKIQKVGISWPHHDFEEDYYILYDTILVFPYTSIEHFKQSYLKHRRIELLNFNITQIDLQAFDIINEEYFEYKYKKHEWVYFKRSNSGQNLPWSKELFNEKRHKDINYLNFGDEIKIKIQYTNQFLKTNNIQYQLVHNHLDWIDYFQYFYPKEGPLFSNFVLEYQQLYFTETEKYNKEEVKHFSINDFKEEWYFYNNGELSFKIEFESIEEFKR